jgi:hypothetical protein
MKTITAGVKSSKLNRAKQNRSVKGVRGFVKAENPHSKIIKVKVTTETKQFLTAYSAKYKVTVSELVMAAVEWYSGFDGSNAEELLNKTPY